jgi:hypothetical protein
MFITIKTGCVELCNFRCAFHIRCICSRCYKYVYLLNMQYSTDDDAQFTRASFIRSCNLCTNSVVHKCQYFYIDTLHGLFIIDIVHTHTHTHTQHTPCRLIAFSSIATTSLPSTPDELNPFVQRSNLAERRLT